MRTLRLLFIVFALGSWLACAGCHITPGPSPMPPDATDSGALPTWSTLDPCGSAFARASALGCEPASAEAGSWIDACRNARAHGLKFGTACIRDATTKAAISSCGVTCQ